MIRNSVKNLSWSVNISVWCIYIAQIASTILAIPLIAGGEGYVMSIVASIAPLVFVGGYLNVTSIYDDTLRTLDSNDSIALVKVKRKIHSMIVLTLMTISLFVCVLFAVGRSEDNLWFVFSFGSTLMTIQTLFLVLKMSTVKSIEKMIDEQTLEKMTEKKGKESKFKSTSPLSIEDIIDSTIAIVSNNVSLSNALSSLERTKEAINSTNNLISNRAKAHSEVQSILLRSRVKIEKCYELITMDEGIELLLDDGEFDKLTKLYANISEDIENAVNKYVREERYLLVDKLLIASLDIDIKVEEELRKYKDDIDYKTPIDHEMIKSVMGDLESLNRAIRITDCTPKEIIDEANRMSHLVSSVTDKEKLSMTAEYISNSIGFVMLLTKLSMKNNKVTEDYYKDTSRYNDIANGLELMGNKIYSIDKVLTEGINLRESKARQMKASNIYDFI